MKKPCQSCVHDQAFIYTIEMCFSAANDATKRVDSITHGLKTLLDVTDCIGGRLQSRHCVLSNHGICKCHRPGHPASHSMMTSKMRKRDFVVSPSP